MAGRTDGTQREWWMQDSPPGEPLAPRFHAVAYYRHSAQDRQENSVAIQQEQVRQWALENGVEIIQEFADRGKSGLTAEGRDGFNEMMESWVKVRNDFDFVLCLDGPAKAPWRLSTPFYMPEESSAAAATRFPAAFTASAPPS